MRDWKKFFDRLFFPPVWLTSLLAAVSAAGLFAVFLRGREKTAAAYVLYVLSFYTLTVICIGCSKVFPGYYWKIRKTVYAGKFGNRYMTDPAFKTHVGLYCSFSINLLYAAVNFFSGIWYGTAWFMLFAAYYFVMAVMRFLLLRYVNRETIHQNRLGELRRARLCAVLLPAVNLSLTGAVLMMIYFGKSFAYSGILIYAMAMYTFYITAVAIVNMLKFKKYNSPVLSMAKSISLAAALMSMLSLETAMLARFGGETDPETRRSLIIATGAGISVIVFWISAVTVRKTGREIRMLRKSGKNL